MHIQSGLPHSKLAELHGNTFKEYCIKCGKAYFRLYHTRNARAVHDHRTGRKCDCGGDLNDSIINFGEDLPEEDFNNAIKNSKMCDLAIVLGTSMRVTPACNLPLMKKSNGRLVICNLQKTPYDDRADIVIHSKTDEILSFLMQELNLPIPDNLYEFQFTVSVVDGRKLLIHDVTTNFAELLSSLVVVDSKDKEYALKKLEVKLQNYEHGESIKIKFGFNLLKPFTGEIILNPPCTISIALNTFKSTMSFIQHDKSNLN